MKRTKNSIYRVLSCVLLIAASAFLFAACWSESIKDPYVSAPSAGVTVEDVMTEPDKYFGKEVVLSGTLKESFGEKAFLIHGKKLVDEMLAVGADPFPESENDKVINPDLQTKAVRVKGIVRKFDAKQFEIETGVSLDDARLEKYAGKPALVVKALERVEP